MGKHTSTSTPQSDPDLYVSQYGEREYEWRVSDDVWIMVPLAEFSTGPRHAAA